MCAGSYSEVSARKIEHCALMAQGSKYAFCGLLGLCLKRFARFPLTRLRSLGLLLILGLADRCGFDVHGVRLRAKS